MIKEINDGCWIYLVNSSAEENRKEIEAEILKPNHGSIGKYLFFSDNKIDLMNVAKKILLTYGLHQAKVPMSDTPNSDPGFGFVLCIYDTKPKLKKELRKYADEKIIRYRYWKSDANTLDGKYSKAYTKSDHGKIL